MQTIAIWSGPRNISTALMRSFENRPDSFVSDEPFYAYYLNKTKLNHPLKEEVIKNNETDFNIIVQYLNGTIPKLKKIWYQKHMAHHILDFDNLDWIFNLKNCILIRDPKEVILSYSEKNKIKNIEQLGFPQLISIYNKLKDKGSTPLVIDSKDILLNPKKTLKILCKKLNIPFYIDMLKWPSGKRKTDGIWGEFWYKNVELSTGFTSYKKNNNEICNEYKNIYKECMDYYNYLYSNKINIK